MTRTRRLLEAQAMTRMNELNRYSPYYDPDKQCVCMSVADNGSWIHVTAVEQLRMRVVEAAKLNLELMAIRESLEARVVELESLLRDIRTAWYDDVAPGEGSTLCNRIDAALGERQP